MHGPRTAKLSGASYGYTYGLYSYGLYSYGLYSYGLYSYGRRIHRPWTAKLSGANVGVAVAFCSQQPVTGTPKDLARPNPTRGSRRTIDQCTRGKRVVGMAGQRWLYWMHRTHR